MGLETAIDLVELAEEEQGEHVPPPRSSPHPGCPVSGRTPEDQKSGGTPQNCQSIKDREGLLAGGEEKGDDLSEVQHGGPSTSKGREEAGEQ